MTALSKEVGTLDASPFIAAKGMRKSFGGAHALKDASLSILPGEVHGLVGANGAGKSTFIRILAGLVQPDAGEILLDGKPFVAASPHYAAAEGLSFIHQELALVPDMTVIENIMLGLPKRSRFGWVDWTATAQEAVPIARRVGVKAPLDAKVKSLSTAENWMISITRSLIRKSRLIVMDEPTAALSVAESDRLFEIIRTLSASGVAVLYVSHRLDEVLDLCQRVTVFRDGRSVAELAGDGLNRRALVEAIIGREPATEGAARALAARPGPELLSVRNLSRSPKVKDISFDLRKGEVLGLGGLVGAGRSELARLIFGAHRPEGGAMSLAGRAFRPRDCSDAVKAGVGFVPEERRAEGLVLTKSVAFNVGLANLHSLVFAPWFPLLSTGRRRSLAETIVRDLSIKTPHVETPVGKLSGGNQQKVLIGRWLGVRPKVLILDEPTRGVDIGARGEIHRLVRELARGGMAVLVISSEPEELPELCDRVLVMASGRIVGELSGRAMTRHGIIAASYAEAGEKAHA
jgi:ribose transport system ATP-binding protein